MTPAPPAPVLVTGATGFVATHIIEQLLRKGYFVRGTVRDAARVPSYLTDLPGSERLTLVAADLLEPGSFDAAVQGCDYVIHTASPYVLQPKDF